MLSGTSSSKGLSHRIEKQLIESIKNDNLDSFNKICTEKNTDKIQRLKIRNQQNDIYDILHIAIDYYATKIVKYLIEKKFPLNTTYPDNFDPLSHASCSYITDKNRYNTNLRLGFYNNDPSLKSVEKSKIEKCFEIMKILLKSDVKKNAESLTNATKILLFSLSSTFGPMDKLHLHEIEDCLILFLENGLVFNQYDVLNDEVKIDVRNLVSNLNFFKAMESLFDKNIQVPKIYRFDNAESMESFVLSWKNNVDEVQSELKGGNLKKRYKISFARLNEAKGYLNSQNMHHVCQSLDKDIRAVEQEKSGEEIPLKKQNNATSLMSMSFKVVVIKSFKHGTYTYIEELARLKFDEKLYPVKDSEMHQLRADEQLNVCINNGTLMSEFYQSFNKEEDGRLTKDDENILNASAFFIGLFSCHKIIKLIEEAYEYSKIEKKVSTFADFPTLEACSPSKVSTHN